jgi:hypothetical protein
LGEIPLEPQVLIAGEKGQNLKNTHAESLAVKALSGCIQSTFGFLIL